MKTKYQELLEAVYELYDLRRATAVLSWDKETVMPKSVFTDRVRQETTLGQIYHEKATSNYFADLIEAAAEELKTKDADDTAVRLVAVLKHDYQKAKKLPKEFVKRRSEANGQGRQAWSTARENNNFKEFESCLSTNIQLNQELADYYAYQDQAYDALIDKYELGMKTADLQEVFNKTKAELSPLIKDISESDSQVDDSLLHQSYDIEKQKEFARYITEVIGYDYSRGALAEAVHPFMTRLGTNDCRITARWYPDFLSPSLFSSLHEAGHAIYEQGIDLSCARTVLESGASTGIHESQSRLFENLVGRSQGFWSAHYPKLQDFFPAQLNKYDLADFYRAINKVQPSFIRVEADELTYNMHIILRFELEMAMLTGDLKAKDLPGAWNEKMEKLLGITPVDDRTGCLQDIHWSGVNFGYFPTYTIGNIYSAQIYSAAIKSNPEITREIDQGQTTQLLSWLRENVHQYGRKLLPEELIIKATGKKLDCQDFVTYVKNKFKTIYNL